MPTFFHTDFFFTDKVTSYNQTKCGIPLGSILGLLLFLIHINDLFEASSNLTSVIFADDTNLFLSRKNIEKLFQSINTELEKAKVWFKANKLSLKTSKTKFYLLHSLKKTIEIPENRLLFLINNVAKKPAKVTKFLGVFLDQNILIRFVHICSHFDKICSKHIDKICSKHVD